MRAQALSNTVWAFSKLDVVDADLFARVVDQALLKLPRFNPQNIANTVRPGQGAVLVRMVRGTLCLSALPCSVCGIGTLPCSVLLKTPCRCLCDSVTLWGWHTTSWIFEVLGAFDDAPDNASTSSSSARAAA